MYHLQLLFVKVHLLPYVEPEVPIIIGREELSMGLPLNPILQQNIFYPSQAIMGALLKIL